MICAVYSAKGGVGKTTIAVNLAWASAALSRRRTLLWDLDAQAGATYVLGIDPPRNRARRTLSGDLDPEQLIQPTRFDGLDVLPADQSLSHSDRTFRELGKRKRLAKMARSLTRTYDNLIIDCPPGLTDTSDQILRAAGIIVVPVVPSALSRRALTAIQQHLTSDDSPDVVLAPVFSMVDRRRGLHCAEMDREPGWPMIPAASAFERMSEERMPVGAFMPAGSIPVRAVASLWWRIEQAVDGPR